MNRSHQREAIMEYLKGATSHPTADEVYQKVREVIPDISLGTVYRNLNLLADNDMILRLHMSDGIDHFDADISEHHHMYCTSCKRVYDLNVKLPADTDALLKAANACDDVCIDSCSIFFFGKCSQCK